jgi:sugar O-acyltransferase (sialic acid O-acetyltransferase NeuD family)
MSLPGILLVGAGGHARACIDVIEAEGRFSVLGLIGQVHEVGRDISGYRVLGSDADMQVLFAACGRALITVGQIASPNLRMRIAEQLAALGIDTPTVISPRAYVSRNAIVGAGTIVLHGAVVNAGARVGDHCILNSQSLVEHDARVDDFCHISTGAILNGGATAGEGSFIGSRSVVKQGVALGQRCIVGMGTVLRRDLADQTTYLG